MSRDTEAVPHGDGGEHPGSLKEYLTGFVLAVILTAIPFWLVLDHTFSRTSATVATILALAAVQMVVHMIYFLHMNTKSEGGWSLLALLFTIMLVVIALSGSLWVMYHLDENMLPTGMHCMHATHDMHDTPGMHHMPDRPDMQ